MTQRSVDSRIRRDMKHNARAQDRAAGCRCPNVRYHTTTTRRGYSSGNDPTTNEVTVTGAPHADTCPLRRTPITNVPRTSLAVPSSGGVKAGELWTP